MELAGTAHRSSPIENILGPNSAGPAEIENGTARTYTRLGGIENNLGRNRASITADREHSRSRTGRDRSRTRVFSLAGGLGPRRTDSVLARAWASPDFFESRVGLRSSLGPNGDDALVGLVPDRRRGESIVAVERGSPIAERLVDAAGLEGRTAERLTPWRGAPAMDAGKRTFSPDCASPRNSSSSFSIIGGSRSVRMERVLVGAWGSLSPD